MFWSVKSINNTENLKLLRFKVPNAGVLEINLTICRAKQHNVSTRQQIFFDFQAILFCIQHYLAKLLRFSKIAFHVKLFFVKQIVLGQRNTLSLQKFFQQQCKSPKLKILLF